MPVFFSQGFGCVVACICSSVYHQPRYFLLDDLRIDDGRMPLDPSCLEIAWLPAIARASGGVGREAHSSFPAVAFLQVMLQYFQCMHPIVCSRRAEPFTLAPQPIVAF